MYFLKKKTFVGHSNGLEKTSSGKQKVNIQQGLILHNIFIVIINLSFDVNTDFWRLILVFSGQINTYCIGMLFLVIVILVDKKQHIAAVQQSYTCM